ncbi:hypothetical protein AYO38_06805 [bacterium SCGC AG-212-C10]|nr:hypothetical protein AYO38_06805 [bacterium SCGC AG-212-C10]
MAKILVLAVAFMLMGTARCFGSDAEVSIPFLSSTPAVAPPASIASIGTPAAITLPEGDYASWFPLGGGADGRDPLNPTLWAPIHEFASAAGTASGWAEACKKMTAVAGPDRAAAPEPGALACSDDPSVGRVQKFALQLLATRAATALWMRGAPGHGSAGIQAHLGQLRLLCGIDVIAREGGVSGPYGSACSSVLGSAKLTEGGDALFAALGAAYATVAAEIARRDPTVDPEAGTFAADPASATATPTN